jgi:hypothetical protein
METAARFAFAIWIITVVSGLTNQLYRTARAG